MDESCWYRKVAGSKLLLEKRLRTAFLFGGYLEVNRPGIARTFLIPKWMELASLFASVCRFICFLRRKFLAPVPVRTVNYFPPDKIPTDTEQAIVSGGNGESVRTRSGLLEVKKDTARGQQQHSTMRKKEMRTNGWSEEKEIRLMNNGREKIVFFTILLPPPSYATSVLMLVEPARPRVNRPGIRLH